METLGVILVFIAVFTLGLVFVYMPYANMQYHQYGVRIRPRKKMPVIELQQPKESLILKALKYIGDMVLSHFPQVADDRTKTLLTHANARGPSHLAIFIGVRTTAVAVVSLLIITAQMDILMKAVILVGAAFVAWIMPTFFLAGKVKRRQNRILHELPTVIDLLIVCAQAGLGLLMCIDKVQKETKATCPNVSAEFEQLLQDVKIFAKSVSPSLKDMGERSGSEDLDSLAGAIMSSEAKGSDISYPLKQQATALRDKLRRKKEEEAAKLPVKMVPIIVFFVLPLLMCPILGPPIVLILQSMGPMMHDQGTHGGH